MKIQNAIVIHGPGRSGTTLLNSILAMHPDLAWISGYINRYPDKLWLTYFNRLQGFSSFEKLNRNKKKFPRPSEAYNFWNYYVPEFDDKDLEKVSDSTVFNTQKAISTIMSYSGKKRFLTKITGNSRHQTLEAVFENPQIIWIDREPKAIIMSYYKQRWRYKNDPEKFASIPKKELIKQYFNLYKSFQEENENLRKFNLKTFYYEDLVKDPHQFFGEICRFVNLEYSERFKEVISSWNIIEGTNVSYKKYISEEEEMYLDDLILGL